MMATGRSLKARGIFEVTTSCKQMKENKIMGKLKQGSLGRDAQCASNGSKDIGNQQY